MQSCREPIARLCRLSISATGTKPRALKYFSTNRSEGAENSNDSKNEEEREPNVELSGFAKAFARFAEPKPEEPEESRSFAHLLRHSNFVDLGDPEGKIVPGRIFHIVGDDLYIDFGWKFHCVCSRPVKNASDYVRGALVRVRIKDLELSTKFLGATKDLTILEADCTLTSLINILKHSLLSYPVSRMTRFMARDHKEHMFKVDDTDVSDIAFDQIFQKLPIPDVTLKGKRKFYYFTLSVPVDEK